MTRERAGPPDRFLLTYASEGDPARAEVDRALADLGPFGAEEVLPGTILVVGDRQRVEAAARPLRQWKLAREGRLSSPRPHRALGE